MPGRPSAGAAVAERDRPGARPTGRRRVDPPSSSARLPAATLWLLAAVAGLAVGRFLLADAPAAPARPPPAATLEARVAALERRVEARPDDLGALQRLGGLYVVRASHTGDPAFVELAGRAFDRADVLAPGAVETRSGRAALAAHLHDFDRALALAESVLDERPHDVTAHAVAVDASVELGRYGDAARRLEAMLDVRPGLAALARVSWLRELHGDIGGAVLAMRQAQTAGEGSPTDLAVVTALLGDLEFRRGRLDAASQAYDRALALAPDLPRAALGHALVRAARGDLGGAVAELTVVTARTPLPEALMALAELQTAAGRRSDAAATVELVRATRRLQEASGQAVDLEYAIFEADLGDGRRAVEMAERAYRSRPGVHAADAMAWALLVAGDAAGAVPYAEEALRLGTGDARLRYHAAAVFAAVGDRTRARDELRTAFAATPWFTWRHRAAAVRLADELDVAPPAAWGAP